MTPASPTPVPPRRTDPILVCSELQIAPRHDPSRALLAPFDWTVQADEFWIVAGAAHSGKSSLLHTLAGLQRPLSGSIRWFGQDIDPLGEPERLAIQLRTGLMFEDGGRLFADKSLEENLLLAPAYHGRTSSPAWLRRHRALLEAANLADVAGKYPHQLTRPQQQRAALLRTLSLAPDVLLLDNPCARLDSGELQWWRSFLNDAHRGLFLPEFPAITLILATDDLRPWIDLNPNLAWIHQGSWHQLGTLQHAALNPSPALASLIEFRPPALAAHH